MAVWSEVKTVTTTASALNKPEDENHEGRSFGTDIGTNVKVRNDGATVVYVGGSDLTSANTATKGYALMTGVAENFVLDAGEVLYAVTAASTQSVSVNNTGA